jgi:opacity protein-like surface antigen
MKAWMTAAVVSLCAGGVLAADPEPGRTDGPEGSEIGKGGYRFGRTPGVFFVEPFLGAAVVDVEIEGAGTDDVSETDLVYGGEIGYLTEDWLGVHVGYAFIDDQESTLFNVGMRQIMMYDPFNYYLRLDAELYSPDGGDTKFGIAPGVGAELMLTDKLRLGLQYQHDFIFSDDNISINRFTARITYKF